MLRQKILGSVAAVALTIGFPVAASADGDTLRIAHNSMPAQFGMPYGTFSSHGAYPLGAVFDTVTYLAEDGSIKPGLALSWEIKEPTVWVLKLRPGVTYHNGRPFTADTIVANVAALLNDPVVKTQQVPRQLAGIPSARKIDNLTVEITTDKPDPVLERRLSIMRPFEPEAWKDMGAEGYGRQPVGTGPYKITSWDMNKIVGVACETCWRVPKIKNLDIREVAELAARVQALGSGQVDIAWSLDPDSRTAIEAAGNKVAMALSTNSMGLVLRHMKEDSPVRDRRVRQALNYAYDKKSFIATVLGGATVPIGQVATPGMTGYFADIEAYPYDPAKAKELLAAAGYPNGFNMVAEMVPNEGDNRDTYQAMANDLKRVGVNLELRAVAVPALVQKILGQDKWSGDAFGMYYEGYPSNDLARPMNTHSCLFSNKHTCFDEIMPTIVAMNTEMDPKKRLELQRKLAQFYHDEAPSIFSHVRVDVDGLAKNLQNYKVINRAVNYADLAFAK